MSEAPADPPRAGFALLFSLSMAQFMVVLDFTIVTAGFALVGLLATRVVPPAPPHPRAPQPHPEPESHHLFRHHAGGIP
jgi:hypothetical protein